MENINSVDVYLESNPKWADCLVLLREIILEAALIECIKWSAPAYAYNGKNIISLVAFQKYVGIWFHQGIFLSDSENKLYNANESSTRGLRQWRFSSIEEVQQNRNKIKAYVLEAIDNQKSGKKVTSRETKTLVVAKELKSTLAGDDKLERAFNKFSISKRIEFSNYISQAKKDVTRQKRLNKIQSLILKGEGLNDKYK